MNLHDNNLFQFRYFYSWLYFAFIKIYNTDFKKEHLENTNGRL